MVKLSVGDVVMGHLEAGKEIGLESGGGLGSMLFVVCVRGSAGPCVCESAMRQISFVVAGPWWEALVPFEGEVRCPKDILIEDISI